MSIDYSDLKDIESHLKRIADALDRAYPVQPAIPAPAPPAPRAVPAERTADEVYGEAGL